MFAATHQGRYRRYLLYLYIYLVVTNHGTDCCRFVHIGIGHFVFNMIMQVRPSSPAVTAHHITICKVLCYLFPTVNIIHTISPSPRQCHNNTHKCELCAGKLLSAPIYLIPK